MNNLLRRAACQCCQRFIDSIRSECLNHFVFFGAQHLDSVARSWLEHYHAEQPHQGRDNELLVRPPGTKKPAAVADTLFSLRDVLAARG